jgi:RimJ/RimL family protein N-acetyltransferase
VATHVSQLLRPSHLLPSFRAALRDRALGKTYPFLICLAGSGRIVGTTQLLDLNPADKRVEIGVTWIAREFWGRAVNLECKQILLRYCFEHLEVNRVQFRAKSDNTRSRRALEKIVATLEGVLRKDKIEPNGNPRDTAIYSIVRDEWPMAKADLANRLADVDVALARE